MRMNKSLSRLAAGCLFGIVLLIVSQGCGPAPQRIVKVYDGDTVRLADGTKVRLIGIDCPEMRDNDKLRADARRSGQALKTIMARGQRAYAFVRDLALGAVVRIEYDRERLDKYGRTLAYIWIKVEPGSRLERNGIPDDFVVEQRVDDQGQAVDYIFLNATILKAGFARPMSIPPNTRFADPFRSFYQDARQHKRGLWG